MAAARGRVYGLSRNAFFARFCRAFASRTSMGCLTIFQGFFLDGSQACGLKSALAAASI